tara:strand:+ start:173 stop:514 length:342 start_codon:yes stop_codon:yes gene_type:complete
MFSFKLSFAQQPKVQSADDALKEQIYNANKKVVVNYSMKDFDALFFESSDKKSDPNILLSKEEFYNYTIKIAAFSDRLAKLYPKEKAVAEESKKKWFAESYQDYLLSKASQKK